MSRSTGLDDDVEDLSGNGSVDPGELRVIVTLPVGIDSEILAGADDMVL